MNKKILLVLFVLIAAGVAGYYVYGPREAVSENNDENQLTIAETSLEGKIVSINAEQVVIEASVIEPAAQGNQAVQKKKTLTFGSEVQFSNIMNPGLGKQVIPRAQLTSRLKAGDRAIFYGFGSGNTLATESFTASRIELLSSASANMAVPRGAPAPKAQ